VTDNSTDETTTTIDRYGVMGYPVSHSRSPVIHRLFALQTGQNIQYELLQVSPEKLETAVRQFQRTGGKGLNITVPHKSEVVRLVDQMSERAATAGAVNTLAFKGGEIYGDNTDGIGLLRDSCSRRRWGDPWHRWSAAGNATSVTQNCKPHTRQSTGVSRTLFPVRTRVCVPLQCGSGFRAI